MNQKIRYGIHIIWNFFRVPLLFLLSFGKIKMPIVQLFSPKCIICVQKKGKILIKRLNSEAGSCLKSVGGLIMVDSTYINRNCMIVSMGEIRIGKNVTIGPNVCIFDHNHNICPENKKEYFDVGEIVIEDGVWIGANAVILKGVHIGNNAVIGAGSVVTKDVPANVMVTGESAKIRRSIK